MNKFRDRYRIDSTRLQNWDYGWDGAYFITICTAHKEHYFGEIENGNMYLSHAGVLADVFWYEIPSHARHVKLDVYIVMPNHVHGILILEGNDDIPDRYAGNGPPRNYPPGMTPGQKRYRNQGINTISSIVGSYKSAVTKHANRLGFEMEWQERFDDRIIRSKRAFETIQQYIINNPQRWHEDRFNNEPPNRP